MEDVTRGRIVWSDTAGVRQVLRVKPISDPLAALGGRVSRRKRTSAGGMTLADHVSIARRFQRSIRLDSDLARVDALQGFVCQRSAADGLTGYGDPDRPDRATGLHLDGTLWQAANQAWRWLSRGCSAPKGAVRVAASAALGITTAQQLARRLPAGPRRVACSAGCRPTRRSHC